MGHLHRLSRPPFSWGISSEIGVADRKCFKSPPQSSGRTQVHELVPALWEPMPCILLAEDDDDLRLLLRLSLQADGYQVIACRDGQKALEVCQQGGHIDLLLSDTQMPRLTGDQLVLKVTEGWPSLPIILMSGSELTMDAISVIQQTGCFFVQKPFQMPKMLAAIRQRIHHADGDGSAMARTA